ncbi:uncharacterized protein B0H18DRAFT_1124184 [Fomitopsis serialis]|uniref:uncharacterized protein n=1 Tax=Fomitopsis serialis TaxID=139415 RepID=UPI00200757DC|nr:uncharacterized protein B0H18DRAFT_1124184 [Neoantrodia serialis]KAH9916547.1 hypothetical protein B0H18DRAFT_1124184 [Neoantrodia serialis]
MSQENTWPVDRDHRSFVTVKTTPSDLISVSGLAFHNSLRWAYPPARWSATALRWRHLVYLDGLRQVDNGDGGGGVRRWWRVVNAGVIHAGLRHLGTRRRGGGGRARATAGGAREAGLTVKAGQKTVLAAEASAGGVVAPLDCQAWGEATHTRPAGFESTVHAAAGGTGAGGVAWKAVARGPGRIARGASEGEGVAEVAGTAEADGLKEAGREGRQERREDGEGMGATKRA